MPNNDRIIELDNVNGVPLLLRVNTRRGSPKSKRFTIHFKNRGCRSAWLKRSIFLALFFNILALFYTRLNVTSIVLILLVMGFLLFFWITHSVQSETLVVIPTVGIQSSIKYVYGRENNFISWSVIDDVIINEVIKLNRVLYFLTVIVNENKDSKGLASLRLMPQFKCTKPRLLMLEAIYAELQSLLSDTKVTTNGSGDVG